MKYLATLLLFIVFACTAHAQEDTTKYMKYPTAYGPQYKDIWATRVMRIPDTSNHPQHGVPGAIGRNAAGTRLFSWDGTQWIAGGSGIIADSVFITSIDSIFITNTDSIFIISGNDTIYIGQNAGGVKDFKVNDTYDTLQIVKSDNSTLGVPYYKISNQWGIVFYGVDFGDTTINIFKGPYAVGVDSNQIRRFVVQTINGDTTLIINQDSSTNWRVNGNEGVGDTAWIGRKDMKLFYVKVGGQTALVVDTTLDILLPKWAGLENETVVFRPGLNGKIDTVHWHPLAAGTNVTFSHSGDTTYINSTGGGSFTSVNDTYQFQDSINTPPVSFPAGLDSTYWLIGDVPTGIFVSHAKQIALYISGVFNSFIVPTLNDVGLTLDDNIWHQYNGTTWVRINTTVWNTNGNLGGGVLGSTNNSNVFLKFNNANRIILQGSGSASSGVRFPTLNGTSNGIAGLNSNGLARRVVVGSGLTYTAGTLVDTLTSSTSGGTLTSFSSGNLSPLFTTSVATSTTTPVQTFALTNAAANTVFGNATGSSAAPSYGQIVNGQITNSTIDLTTKVTGALPIANGGTNNGSLSVTAGTVYYGDGTKLVGLAPGTTKQHLTGGTTPSWKDTATAGGTISAPAGYTLHGTGTGVYQDTIIYKDTAKSWVGINTTTPLGVLQIYPTFPGTVATTSGSATVTGTNTRFLSNFRSGDSIFINSATYATVLSIASNTSLTLTANFGSSLSGVAYTNPAANRGVFSLSGKWAIYQYADPFIYNGATILM
jgi:hypothetical protein